MAYYRVYISVIEQELDHKTTPGDSDHYTAKPGGASMEVVERVEARYLLQALGIVLRRATEIPLALQAAAPDGDPFRKGSA